MHLDHAFLKYTNKVDCNLICIGQPGCLKSTLLNQVFGFKFETMGTDEKKCSMFHDSVDVTFASKDIKHAKKDKQKSLQLNVFDFQGSKANIDFKLIKEMLERMPRTYLLIQISDPITQGGEESYLERLTEGLGGIGEVGTEMLSKLRDESRLLIIAKGCQDDDEDLHDSLVNSFNLDLDEDDHLIEYF